MSLKKDVINLQAIFPTISADDAETLARFHRRVKNANRLVVARAVLTPVAVGVAVGLVVTFVNKLDNESTETE